MRFFKELCLSFFLFNSLCFSLEFIDGIQQESGTDFSALRKAPEVVPEKIPLGLTFSDTGPTTLKSLISEKEGAKFDPHWDGPDFLNFSSNVIQNAQTGKSSNINRGTCYGIIYFTSIWYSRITRPLLEGGELQLGQKAPELGFWDHLFYDTEGLGKLPSDGVTYVAQEIQRRDPLYLSRDKDQKLNQKRLYEISEGPFEGVVKKAAIAHHQDQFIVDEIEIDSANHSDLQKKILELKNRLEKNHTQMLYWYEMDPSQKFLFWKKYLRGHAVLAYDIELLDAEASNGKTYPAWKISFMDPNMTYHHSYYQSSDDDNGECKFFKFFSMATSNRTCRFLFGDFNKRIGPSERSLWRALYPTYLLYFPETRQIAFSEKYRLWYNFTDHPSFIDNEDIVLAYPDIYEGHPIQAEIAKKIYLRNSMGKGGEI
jgi:hypothetical protein